MYLSKIYIYIYIYITHAPTNHNKSLPHESTLLGRFAFPKWVEMCLEGRAAVNKNIAAVCFSFFWRLADFNTHEFTLDTEA